MFDKVVGWIKKLTEASVALLALSIVMQIIIGNITGIVATLGAQGLVGLASIGVIYAIFTRP